jgi:hypothetical protein
MNPIVRHILIYSTGLVSGVVLTLGIVKFLDSGEEKAPATIMASEPINEVKTDTVEKVVYKKPKKTKKETDKKDSDSTSLMVDDTLIYFNTNDSLQDLKINRELLIATRNFKVIKIESDTSESNALIDSLEQTMGIITDKGIKSIKVEFWKSPLNFEGYILGKNFVKLYGISELDQLKFYRVDRRIYMKTTTGVYSLIRSEEYRKFELSKEGIDDKILQISRNG